MKTIILPALCLFAALAATASAQSKRTAEFILSDPSNYEGKEVTLDVAMVKPVQWQSPLEDFAFFWALTIDRQARQPGGHILTAIPASESAAFAKKYGTNFEGRTNMTTLRGTLVAVGSPKERRPKIWVIDTTGKLLAEIERKSAEMPNEAFLDSPRGPGGPGGPGGPMRGQRLPAQN